MKNMFEKEKINRNLLKLKNRITERKINLLFICKISYSWQYKTKLENIRFPYIVFLVEFMHQNIKMCKLMKV